MTTPRTRIGPEEDWSNVGHKYCTIFEWSLLALKKRVWRSELNSLSLKLMTIGGVWTESSHATLTHSSR